MNTMNGGLPDVLMLSGVGDSPGNKQFGEIFFKGE